MAAAGTFVLRLLVLAVLGLQAAPEPRPGRPDAPQRLRCEYLADPLGIDVARPRLSWEVSDARRGARQSAYQVLVADDPNALLEDRGTLWDSGRVESDRTHQVEYGGRPLASRQQVWWKVRTWDQNGEASAWSRAGRWSMGLLDDGDWEADWIGDATPAPATQPAHNGYHTELARSADIEKWVEIDLGSVTKFDGVRLWPARPFDWRADVPGLMFPIRLRIETRETADGAATVAVDRTSADLPNPGVEPLTLRFEDRAARVVRLHVTRLGQRDPEHFAAALAEMEVLRGDEVISTGRPVAALDSIEYSSWSKSRLTDGDLRSHAAGGWDPLPAPLVRRTFAVPAGEENRAKLRSATLTITALGLYEARLNGRKVGENRLAPEWTDYHKRVQYQIYDVLGLLRGGENALGVALGDGWYAGSIGLIGAAPGSPPRGVYGRLPKVRARLELVHEDGRIEAVVTDSTWRSTLEGPTRVADLLDGEEHDARREQVGWDEPGFDDGTWRPVQVYAAAGRSVPANPALRSDGLLNEEHGDGGLRLVAQPNEPIRELTKLRPQKITEPAPGVYVFDLGQNMVGVCRLSVRGPAGTTITLRHGEVLNPDGTLYTANLRGAAQVDRYTLGRPGGRLRDAETEYEIWEPRFTYHGFRYVEVTGLPEPPTPGTISGVVFNSTAPEVSEFECSSPLLNQLWKNILWTQRGNLMSTPTDCPQRDERMGWTGDILAFAHTACFNADMGAFYTKWMRDMRDAQAADGRFADFAPQPFDPNVRFSGVPAWGDAGVFVPWSAYVHYGDRRILEENFEAMCRWVDWIAAHNPDHLWKNRRHNDYGDWLNVDTLRLEGWPQNGAEMPKEAFATAFFARSAQIVAATARVLAETERASPDAPQSTTSPSHAANAAQNRAERYRQAAQRYQKLADQVRAAFQTAYLQPDGALLGDTQAGYAIALAFDLIPAELQEAAFQRMIAKFEPYRGHIQTGFHSTICLMNELTVRGRADEAYRLIHMRTMPSWGYLIDQGATTIWERWDGYVEGRGFQDPGMNSFSHYAFGSVGEWMYRTILGLNPEGRPGALPSANGAERRRAAVEQAVVKQAAAERVAVEQAAGDPAGWRRFVVRPRPGNLTWARGRHRTIAGTIAVEWKVEAGRFTLNLTIPPNTTARVLLPTADAEAVMEGDGPARDAEGVRALGILDGAAAFEVGGGTYRFRSPLDAP